jgi:hypothetical protein
MCFNLHLDHLQRTSENPAEDIAVPKLILRSAIVRQLHKVG